MTGRRFPPPWTVIERAESFWVQDASGQTVGWFYFRDNPETARHAGVLERRWPASRSQIRLHGLRCRRERVQTEDPRHRRQLRAPRAPQPEHERGGRGEGMTINLPKINCPARAAARAEHIEPRRPCDQRGPDRRRPQDVPVGDKMLIPASDDGLRLGARGRIGNLPLGIGGNVEAPRPNAHAAVSAESSP